MALFTEDTLGAILLKAGRVEEAELLLRRLVPIAQRVIGENHWAMPYIRAHHGMCLVELGRYDEASYVQAAAHVGVGLGRELVHRPFVPL